MIERKVDRKVDTTTKITAVGDIKNLIFTLNRTLLNSM